MTDFSKMTKAELLRELGAVTNRLEVERSKMPSRPPEPQAVPEADAIAACIRALDKVETNGHNTFDYRKTSGGHKRILVHLADKYGVELIEVRTEPCSRPHLDQVDPSAISNAVQYALTNQASA